MSHNRRMFFSLKVSSEGCMKQLLFICENVAEKNEWIKQIDAALDEVRHAFESMHELFTLKLEFAKEKLGICVGERVLINNEYDAKVIEEEDNHDARGIE